MNRDINIEFENRRCGGCGRFWAHEKALSSSPKHYRTPICHYCAADEQGSKSAALIELSKENSSLRGQITKLKNAKPVHS